MAWAALRLTALCQTRLIQFATDEVFTRADLALARVDVVPTFRTPHVTLAAADVDALVAALLSCPRRELTNPYHEGLPRQEEP